MRRSTTSMIDQVRKVTMVFVAYLCLKVKGNVCGEVDMFVELVVML